jgi:hypothetical protein
MARQKNTQGILRIQYRLNKLKRIAELLDIIYLICYSGHS